jgi:uncharacterized protein
MNREFQIFVKPVGASCNLRCSYCYYLAKKDLYTGQDTIRMNDKILEKYIIQHIEASADDVIMFSWHGGEPAMAGLDFFRKAVALQQKYVPAGRRVINGIQTNGILLDDDWCSFMSEEDFMVGISIDGPEDLHNRYRCDREGKGSFERVLRGYGLLQKYGITTEILCVLNSQNVKYPLAIYDFFKDLGARYITFLPLVEHQPASPTGASSDSVSAEEYGLFLSKIFDEWVDKDIGRIKIQVFEEASRTAFNQDHTLCIFKVNCGGVPVVEQNGDFYSCDHYVDKAHCLGNIMDNSIASLLDSNEQKAFGMAKSETLPDYCIECSVRVMCNGECPKNRFIKTPDGQPGLNYLCRGYKLFFEHCRPFIETLRDVWRSQKNV